jgi:hypothetical protein
MFEKWTHLTFELSLECTQYLSQVFFTTISKWDQLLAH